MSTNISKQKREDLLNKIKEIRTFISAASQDENTSNLLSYLSDLEKDVNGKKYGLVFEEHREKIDEVLDTHTPVLTEEKGLFIDNGGQMNFLIEGDNLASLKLLEKTHKGKIDLIYIDPPYNTGNQDFIYDDAYIDATDVYRHSKWLSFLIKRIKSARTMLSNEGVIFISIDDNEQAQLKTICNDVFGEYNFIAQFTVASNSAKNNSKFVSITHEYLLCYAKNKSALSQQKWAVKKTNLDDFKKQTATLLSKKLTNEEIHKEILALVKYPKYYEFDHYTYVDKRGPFRASDLTAPGSTAHYDILHPITKLPCKQGTRGWAYSQNQMDNRK